MPIFSRFTQSFLRFIRDINGEKKKNLVIDDFFTVCPLLTEPKKKIRNGRQVQKNPRVREIRVRNSGAGNGCANFMDAWKNAFFLQEKPHVE